MRIHYNDIANFFRALLMVLLFTFSTYLIANNYLWMALLVSIGISITWIYNVSAVVTPTIRTRVVYILGAACGTYIALFILLRFL